MLRLDAHDYIMVFSSHHFPIIIMCLYESKSTFKLAIEMKNWLMKLEIKWNFCVKLIDKTIFFMRNGSNFLSFIFKIFVSYTM